jgi:hypothetical protein
MTKVKIVLVVKHRRENPAARNWRIRALQHRLKEAEIRLEQIDADAYNMLKEVTGRRDVNEKS